MADLIATSGQVLDGDFDLDLVSIKTAGNCLTLRGDARGRIGRLELTNTSGSGDCLILGNKTGTGRVDIGLPKPGKLGGGFLHQPTKSGTSHNDAFQVRGGSHVHLWDIVFKGPDYEKSVNASQGALFQNSGQGFPGPLDVVCHRCVFCGRFSNPVNWGSGSDCGIEDCFVIGSKGGTSGSLIGASGHTRPVNLRNAINLPRTHAEIAYAYDHLAVSWLGEAEPPPPPPPDPPPTDPCADVKAQLAAANASLAAALAERDALAQRIVAAKNALG